MQRGLYESSDIQAAVQQALLQGINPGVLRGIEGGTLHFVTVQRSGDQEYIDHSLLNPEYITAHIQNGMLINVVPATTGHIAQYEQLPEIVHQQDDGTLQDDGTQQDQYVEVNHHHQQQPPPPQYLQQKHEIQEQTLTSVGEETVLQQNHQHNDNDLVTYIQCVGDTSAGQQLIQTNEAQVIVSNKQQMNPVPPLTLLTRSQPKRSVKAAKIQHNNMPPELQQNLHVNQSESEWDSEEAGGGIHNQRRSRGRPKKLVNLPHKKRISNKLKVEENPTKRMPTTKRTAPKQIVQKQQPLNSDQVTFPNEPASAMNGHEYVCEECAHKCDSQFSLFLHLKLHYESNDVANIKTDNNTMILVANNETFFASQMTDELQNDVAADDVYVGNDLGVPEFHDDSSRESKYTVVKSETSANNRQYDVEPASQPDEFSDDEDMLEGIRGTVDQLQQSVDNDINHEENAAAAAANWFTKEPTNTIQHKPQYDGEPAHAIDSTLNVRQLLLNKTNISTSDDAVQLSAATDTGNGIPDEKDAVVAKKAKKIPRTVASQMKEFIEETYLASSDTEAVKSKKRRKFKCRICEKVCNSKNSLHYHFLSHTGERPHQCDICGKGFFAAGALKVHNRLHSGAKPYSCDVCGRAFRQWGDLKYHIVSLHTDAKQHQCEFCGKEFSRRYSLVLHRRIHTGERNYKCEFCDKTFRASSYLQDHRRIHTGEKPHPCEVCGKKFRIRSDLKRHENIHTRGVRGRCTKVSSRAKVKEAAAVDVVPDASDLEMAHSSDGMLIKIELEQRDGLLTSARESKELVANATIVK